MPKKAAAEALIEQAAVEAQFKKKEESSSNRRSLSVRLERPVQEEAALPDDAVQPPEREGYDFTDGSYDTGGIGIALEGIGYEGRPQLRPQLYLLQPLRTKRMEPAQRMGQPTLAALAE